MYGFIVGLASLLGLVCVMHRGRHRSDGRFGSWSGGRRSWWLGRIFSKLDTTPAQERVIRDALGDVVDNVREHREEHERTRQDLASVMRDPDFEPDRLAELFARHDQVLSAVRAEVMDALGKIHGTLDDEQRARLARMIERHGHWFRHRGGHRDEGAAA